tara:strand:+ start:767 stop:2065 length:1299 start_codon:yes stop_codon:yes gene_type:complete
MSLPVRPEIGKEQYLSKTKGIGGKLRGKPEDFIVKEIINLNEKTHWIWSKKNNQGKHSIAKITANNWDTHVLVKELAKELNIGQKAIGFAGTKDKRAVTTQHFSLMAKQESIEKINLKNVDIEYCHSTIKPIRLGNLIGNKFTIKITNIEKNGSNTGKIINELKDGFPNYFGIQRFGAVRPITHLIGEKIIEGDYEGAVWKYLCDGNEKFAGFEARQKLDDTRNLETALKEYPRSMLFERQMIGYLSRKKDDYIGALRQLPENLSKMFVHAYQSSIFNQTVDMRLKMGEKLHVPLIGDNVIPIDNYGGPDQRRVIEVTEFNQNKLKRRCKEGKAWVVGLLPGLESKYTKGLQGDLEKKIMNKEKISFKDYRIKEIPNFTSLGMYRPLCQKINDLEWSIEENGDVVLSFWLHKGTYATSFLREVMKSKDVRAY